MRTKQIVLLMSGGLDSTILLNQLLRKFSSVLPLYIQCGHIWEKAEHFWLKRCLKNIRNSRLKPLVSLLVPTVDLYQHHWSHTGQKIPAAKSRDRSVYLPGKNILLLTKAAVFCMLRKIHHLAIGPLKTNPFPDATPQFFKMMERICSSGLKFDLRIHAPFLS